MRDVCERKRVKGSEPLPVPLDTLQFEFCKLHTIDKTTLLLYGTRFKMNVEW